MKRPQLSHVLLAVTLMLNLVLLAGAAAMIASDRTAGGISSRLHVASQRQAARAQRDADSAVRQLGATDFGTVADALDGLTGVADDLDGRLSDVEGELDEFAPRSLAGDVRDLRRDLDALGLEVSGLSNKLDSACSAAGSAATQYLGTDLFYVFLGLQRAFC